jgi:[NiFe] hydrogenase small subunit
MSRKKEFEAKLEQRGISRRQFLKYCGVIAGAIGLGPGFGSRVYAALAAGPRPPVIWLHMAECTGCTEAVLRSSNPSFEQIILDTISLEYHETLMAAAGDDVTRALTTAADRYPGEFFCVVEGAIPTAANGIYGMIGGHTMLSIAQEVCTKAKAIIALGNCASYGGLPAAWPNPTGAQGVESALDSLIADIPVVNLPGCPPNPINFVGTLANYLLNGSLPALDADGRPQFAYGNTVHNLCPYRENESRCLEDDGCKGKQCHHNCPSIKYNDGTSFPMQAGHPCIGCSEPDFWDRFTPFYVEQESSDESDGDGDSYDDD